MNTYYMNPQKRHPWHIEITVHQSSTLTLGQVRKQFEEWRIQQSSENNNESISIIEKNGQISLTTFTVRSSKMLCAILLSSLGAMIQRFSYIHTS